MLSSATVKIAVANKTLVKTNFSSVTFCSDKTTKLSDLKMSIRFDIVLITNLAHYPKYQSMNTFNSSIDFSENLRTKPKQCQPKQLAWKTIRTKTKLKKKIKFLSIHKRY